VLVLPPEANVDSERVLPDVYVVQPGDTLSAIAVALGLTMQELMDANSITDPNSILVGQELIVPGGS
jgi:LysM repeat protein